MADTARWTLPLLDAGQAQKEMTVNEALVRLDLATQAGVTALGLNAPPVAPADGEAWIVGTAPTGAWVGQAGTIAGWTAGGWRFVAPREGMSAWVAADGCPAIYAGDQWHSGAVIGRKLEVGGVQVVGAQAAAIASPAGGNVVDAEARATLAALLAAVRDHGLVAR